MKMLLLTFFCAIIATNAVDVTDEDTDSPLVSYLLAKVQRLEAKMMSKEVSVRTTEKLRNNQLIITLVKMT